MSEGNDMESKQAVKESLTTDLTKRLALTFLRAGCAVTGEPLGAKELETMDPVDRQGIEAGIEAVVAAEWITHPNHRHQQSGSTGLNALHTHQHHSCNQRIC